MTCELGRQRRVRKAAYRNTWSREGTGKTLRIPDAPKTHLIKRYTAKHKCGENILVEARR